MTAVADIDAFLSDTRHQSLLDADKVRDFLLDLRSVVEALQDAIYESWGDDN